MTSFHVGTLFPEYKNFVLYPNCVSERKRKLYLPYSNLDSPWVTQIGPPMWQAKADTELTLSASPATAVGQSKLNMANLGLTTVAITTVECLKRQAKSKHCLPNLLHRPLELPCRQTACKNFFSGYCIVTKFVLIEIKGRGKILLASRLLPLNSLICYW